MTAAAEQATQASPTASASASHVKPDATSDLMSNPLMEQLFRAVPKTMPGDDEDWTDDNDMAKQMQRFSAATYALAMLWKKAILARADWLTPNFEALWIQRTKRLRTETQTSEP